MASILHRIDVNTQAHHEVSELHLNEIGLLELSLAAPIAFDPYHVCKGTGSFIVIDRLTNVTIGAGMIVGESDRSTQSGPVTHEERVARFGQKAITVWVSGNGSEHLATALERKLFDTGHPAIILDHLATEEITDQINRAGMICIVISDHNTAPADAWIISADTSSAQQIFEDMKDRGVLTGYSLEAFGNSYFNFL